MKSCYIKAYNYLIDMVEKSRESLLESHKKYEISVGNLLTLGDKHYNTYNSIVEINEFRAAKAVESIAVSLLSETKTADFTYYPISNNIPLIEAGKLRPFQIVLNEKGKRVGIIFCNMSDIGDYYKKFIDGEYAVDAIKLIVLSNPDDFARKTLFAEVNTFNLETGVCIERIPIMEFWEQLFGIDECNNFIDFINKYNESAQKIIGFNTVVSPTDNALAQFREKCGDILKETVNSHNIPDAFVSQKEILKLNYIDRKLWKAMIGKSNFATSFITSEWFFNMYQLTENLDLTNIAAGYLKSIEQLLFAIIKLYSGKGITVRGKNKRIIELTKDNEDIVDSTLGSLEMVIKYNDILEINEYAQTSLIKTIDDWRNKQRNGYFHKDNIHSIDKVNEIREKAFLLYFLILGSCTIKDEQFAELGIDI